MKDEVQNVLSDDERKRIHEILGRMGYHPYPVLDPPKPLWSKRSSTMNCPDDDMFKEIMNDAFERQIIKTIRIPEKISMNFNQFDGFMEKASKATRPLSILNTLHSLDEQGCNSKDNEIRIIHRDWLTVEYELIAELDDKDIEITTEPDNWKEVYHNVCYLMVKVTAHTRVEKHEFVVDFENKYYVLENNKDTTTETLNPRMIKEIKILEKEGGVNEDDR